VGVTGNAGQANYAAAKAGMIAMAKSLAQEVASRGITVNTIAPGLIETAMTNVLADKQKDAILALVPAGQNAPPGCKRAGRLCAKLTTFTASRRPLRKTLPCPWCQRRVRFVT
jgi:NAD(P)-dependent dehydrogenase (short-subunit alcohol dehydrogenase family)